MSGSSRHAVPLAAFCAVYVLICAAFPACAETSTVWNYKGSAAELTQSGSEITIRFSTPSRLLSDSGAHDGDVLFRGQRFGDRLSGTAYKFYGPQCGAIGFAVHGSIRDGDKIMLQGIAPGLGATSCNQVTEFYDTLLLTAVSTGQGQAAIAPQEDGAFKHNVSLCQTGDQHACRAVLASPLLNDEDRPRMEAASKLPDPNPNPVFLLFKFLCVVENGEPAFKPSSELYYYEALSYRPSQTYSLCSSKKDFWGMSFLPACQAVALSSFRLVCKDGIVNAPQLTLANTPKYARVEGDHVLAPFFSRFRDSDAPESLRPLPAGWGIVPEPRAVMNAKDLPILFAKKEIPVTGHAEQVPPKSFFLGLANAAPLPHMFALLILAAAALLAGFGFSLYPESPLGPRRYGFWLGLAIAVLGLMSSLSAGDAIKEAFAQGERETRVIAADQAMLNTLFPKYDGHFAPFQERDLNLARELMRPRAIPNAAAIATEVPGRAFLYLLPVLAFLIVYARFIFAGYHYLFVRHPAEEVAAPALQSGQLFDKNKLADSLAGDPHDLSEHPPVHRTWNLLRRARILRDKIEADADIAEAAMRRDRARAAQAEAQREWREARKKLPWWQRLLVR
jgi:hypothetical protein